MPQATIYLREQDQQLVESAKPEYDDSRSAVVREALQLLREERAD